MSVSTIAFIVIDFMIFVLGAIIGSRVALAHYYHKFYDEKGKCRECRYPRDTDEMGLFPHHPNCPIGRLDI